MWANNETGVIFPVEALAEEAKAVGAVFHTDAVQAAGRVPINLKRSAIDLCRSPRTSCTDPRASERFTFGAALSLRP